MYALRMHRNRGVTCFLCELEPFEIQGSCEHADHRHIPSFVLIVSSTRISISYVAWGARSQEAQSSQPGSGPLIKPIIADLDILVAQYLKLLLNDAVSYRSFTNRFASGYSVLVIKEVKERLASVRAFATALEEACKAASSGRTLSMLASDSLREHPVEAEQKSYQLNVQFHNLPAQLTPLIGREQEIRSRLHLRTVQASDSSSQRARQDLMRDQHLSGPGGICCFLSRE